MKTTIVASVFALAALTTTTPVELESRDDSLPDNTFGRLDVYSTPECTNSELLGDQGKDIFVPRNICTPTLITEVDALGVKVEVATMSYRAHLFFGDDQGHLGGGCAFFLLQG
ncbi:uncharacterized protein KY384_000747 [Bacidia gigantensis]|uniref:uncharacterized protein n=1 Tax=Bacidia gigantensis TaxID=2732470 RepID=UPI001D03FD97|nr:uncharacterized protein KY384_000747 [Bacidia gigantensis]KAG8525985.1 hypothetical protein KY384_000747 [Bacidia gigantensis]